MKRIDPTTQPDANSPEPAAIPRELDPQELRNLTEPEKRQHLIEGIFRALEAEGAGRRQQPPRVDRFREVKRLVEAFEAQGVPFGVSSTSIMNRCVRQQLNEQALASDDTRKSRRKQITPAAVRKWLRDYRYLQSLADHFTKMHPYAD